MVFMGVHFYIIKVYFENFRVAIHFVCARNPYMQGVDPHPFHHDACAASPT